MDQKHEPLVEAYKKGYKEIDKLGPEGTDEELARRLVGTSQVPAQTGMLTVMQAEALGKAEAEQWQRYQAGQAGPGTNSPATGYPPTKAKAGKAAENSKAAPAEKAEKSVPA